MQPVVFRSTFNRVLSIAAWALLTIAAIGTLLTPGALPALAGLPLGAAGGAALVWAILWSPHVRVDDEEVRVANVFLEHAVPWAALIHVDTQYALTLHTPGRRIRATAAPAPGQLAAFRATRADRRNLGRLRAEGVRPGDLPGTDSGRAALLVRDRWEQLRDAGLIEPGLADVTPVVTRPRVAAIAGIVVGAAAIVVAAFTV